MKNFSIPEVSLTWPQTELLAGFTDIPSSSSNLIAYVNLYNKIICTSFQHRMLASPSWVISFHKLLWIVLCWGKIALLVSPSISMMHADCALHNNLWCHIWLTAPFLLSAPGPQNPVGSPEYSIYFKQVHFLK